MKNILVTGSIAYDNIMLYDGKFKDALIPRELDNLSISFSSKTKSVQFGGTCGNIAYSLKLLGEDPLIVGVVGNDFDKYKKWMKKNKIGLKHVEIDKERQTAAVYILNDQDQNQIAIFSPGAMENAGLAMELRKINFNKVACAIIAPGLPERMVALAKECMKYGVPYIFDPGQATPSLSKEDIELMVDGSFGMIVNEYESTLLERKLNMITYRLASKSGFLVKTMGEKGCQIYHRDENEIVPALKDLKIVDVTGGGDAFRAGFLHGYVADLPLKRCCQMGNVAASYTLDNMGTQGHRFNLAEFNARLKKVYGE